MGPLHRKTAAFILLSALLVTPALVPRTSADKEDGYSIILDGQEVETKVPAVMKGRNLLLPGDLVSQKLHVSISWTKKRMGLVYGRHLAEIRNDKGKTGGLLVDGVPMVPAKILRDAFNIWIKWDRVKEKVEIKTTEKYNIGKEEKPPEELVAPGALIPDYTLQDLEGNPVALSAFVGKKLALVVFASWDNSRGHLKAWQKFHAEHGDGVLAIVGVAMDAHPGEKVARYARRAEVTFPILLDTGNLLGRAFGFTSVPIVIVADELGKYTQMIPPYTSPKQAIRHLKRLLKQEIYPEYIYKPEAQKGMTKRQVIQAVTEKSHDIPLRIQMAEVYRNEKDYARAISQMESAHRADEKSGEVLFRWGLYLFIKGDRQGAIGKWREAAVREPNNWLIRKEIWALEFPERFYRGPIDLAWQAIQMQKGQ